MKELSITEREVISWASIGKNQAETAEIMSLSRPHVGRILMGIYDKLGAANAAGAVGICFRHGILKVPSDYTFEKTVEMMG